MTSLAGVPSKTSSPGVPTMSACAPKQTIPPLGPDGLAEVDVETTTVPTRIATNVMPVTDRTMHPKPFRWKLKRSILGDPGRWMRDRERLLTEPGVTASVGVVAWC